MRLRKALAIKQPWIWLIINRMKDIEIRTWNTDYRGALALYSSRSIDSHGYIYLKEKGVQMPLKNLLITGSILGYATLNHVINFVDSYQFNKYKDRHLNSSTWYDGRQKGFVFENIHKTPPITIEGKLGIFDIDEEV